MDDWIAEGAVSSSNAVRGGRGRGRGRARSRGRGRGRGRGAAPPPLPPAATVEDAMAEDADVIVDVEGSDVIVDVEGSDVDIEIVFDGTKPSPPSPKEASVPAPEPEPEPGPSGQDRDTQETSPRLTEEEFDIAHHKKITARRNFDSVNFGQWQIKTWYFSPYPLTESEPDAGPPDADARIPGVARATFRSHGRTSDLLAGGLGRDHAAGARSVLWVCDRCFKYMAEGTSWEAHVRRCTRKNPPGRKVYQRGAHTIWEVDGAKEKLYCQNLSLFGKLFIDVKTLFFDCDNFLFYLLTDADSQRDHVIGFFSKEKVSYDDYNLACIIVLPPYQRKGYGMLMIEFSYELSRRAGRVGTPERPLSDLGLRSYLTYWVSTLIRYFRHVLSVLPSDLPRLTTTHSPDFDTLRTPSSDPEQLPLAKRRRKTKGWDGEAHALRSPPPTSALATSAVQRTLETRANADGSATTHAVVRCSLADVARATHLRVDDAAFALNECGLLVKRYERVRAAAVEDREMTGRRKSVSERSPERATGSPEKDAGDEDEEGEGEMVVVTREMVEVVARERGLKRMYMDIAHVLL